MGGAWTAGGLRGLLLHLRSLPPRAAFPLRLSRAPLLVPACPASGPIGGDRLVAPASRSPALTPAPPLPVASRAVWRAPLEPPRAVAPRSAAMPRPTDRCTPHCAAQASRRRSCAPTASRLP